ncbi:adenine deaminase, partial [gut metagenome]
VFHKGVDAVKAAAKVERTTPAAELRGSVRPAAVSEAVFTMPISENEEYHVIDMLPGEIFTEHAVLKGTEVQKGLADGTIHFIAVLERHHGTGNVGLGVIRGYGLKNGAVATTVAHDSHNLIVLGSNPKEMSLAAQELVKVQGGYTIVNNGSTVTLPLSICGLMSTLTVKLLTLL